MCSDWIKKNPRGGRETCNSSPLLSSCKRACLLARMTSYLSTCIPCIVTCHSVCYKSDLGSSIKGSSNHYHMINKLIKLCNCYMTANAFKKAWFKLATDTETETEAPNSIQNPARSEQKRTEGLVFFCSLSVLQGLYGISCFRLRFRLLASVNKLKSTSMFRNTRWRTLHQHVFKPVWKCMRFSIFY